jgi:hypothetical protein
VPGTKALEHRRQQLTNGIDNGDGRPPCDCGRHDRAKVRFVFGFDVSELRAVSQRLQRGAEHEQPADRSRWPVVVQVETEDTSAVRQSLSLSGLR